MYVQVALLWLDPGSSDVCTSRVGRSCQAALPAGLPLSDSCEFHVAFPFTLGQKQFCSFSSHNCLLCQYLCLSTRLLTRAHVPPVQPQGTGLPWGQFPGTSWPRGAGFQWPSQAVPLALSARLNLRELGPWASHMRWLVWIMASVGTVYVFFFHER